MFSIGEKVMYGGTGVCVVEEITSVKFSASQPGKPYYLLRPMYQTGTIQTPADSGKVPIRPVMNRSEAEAVIDAMPTVPAEICTEKNLSALRNYYQKQITSFDSMDLIRLAKSIRAKKIEAEKRQKRIGSTDEKYLRRAEELLFGELAVALEISTFRRSSNSGSARWLPRWSNYILIKSHHRLRRAFSSETVSFP